jgi:hypothetical protein
VDGHVDLVAPRLGEVLGAVAGLEGQHQRGFGGKHPAELGQHAGQFAVGDVDDGQPGVEAGQAAVRLVEPGHRADLEPQVGIRGPGLVDHDGRQVDSEDVQTLLVQEGRDLARPAAHVGGRAGRQLREQGQQAAFDRLPGQVVGDERRVAGGHGVVRRTGPVEVKIIHGWAS